MEKIISETAMTGQVPVVADATSAGALLQTNNDTNELSISKGMLMDTMDDVLLNPKEAVTMVFGSKISYRELLKLSRDGSVPCLKIGNRYLYHAGVLKQWLQANVSTPAHARIRV